MREGGREGGEGRVEAYDQAEKIGGGMVVKACACYAKAFRSSLTVNDKPPKVLIRSSVSYLYFKVLKLISIWRENWWHGD